MMLHPSYADLIESISAGTAPGEQPSVPSRYSIVIASAKRARQIVDGAEPMVAAYGKKPLSVAVDEINTLNVKIINDEVPED